MSPKSFTFKLTVPRDPQALAMVSAMAGHAVVYAEVEAAAGAGFVTRVEAAASKALKAPGPAVLIVVTGDASAVTFTIDAEPVAVTHSA